MSNWSDRPWFHPAMLLPPDPDARYSPWSGHVPFAHWLIAVAKPGVVVELGTASGTSYFAMCRSAARHSTATRLFAVDTWQGDEHAGAFDTRVYDFVAARNRSYAGSSTLLRGTFDEALQRFEGGSIDLLHIDGFHTYEAVRHDFETWRPKLTPNAVVLFHDIAEQKQDFGVWKYWDELKSDFPTAEFRHSHGLGVLFMGKPPAPQLAALADDITAAQTAFSREAENAGHMRPSFTSHPQLAMKAAFRIFGREGWGGVKRRLLG